MAKVVKNDLVKLEAIVARAGCSEEVLGRLQKDIKEDGDRIVNMSKDDFEYISELLSDNIDAVGNDPHVANTVSTYNYVVKVLEDLENESQAVKMFTWFEKKGWGSLIVYKLDFPGRPVIVKHGTPYVYEGEALVTLGKSCKGFTKHEKRVITQITKDLGGGFYHE